MDRIFAPARSSLAALAARLMILQCFNFPRRYPRSTSSVARGRSSSTRISGLQMQGTGSISTLAGTRYRAGPFRQRTRASGVRRCDRHHRLSLRSYAQVVMCSGRDASGCLSVTSSKRCAVTARCPNPSGRDGTSWLSSAAAQAPRGVVGARTAPLWRRRRFRAAAGLWARLSAHAVPRATYGRAL